MRRRTYSLRVRIITIVLAALLALIAVGTATAVLREREAQAAVSEVLLNDLGLVWRDSMSQSSRGLAEAATAVLGDPLAMRAMADADPAGLAVALAPHLGRMVDRFGSGRVELLDDDGGVAFNSGGEFSWRATLASEQVASVVAGETVDTVQIDWSRSVVAAHAVPVDLGGRRMALTLSAGIATALEHLKRSTDSEAMIVNRRGRLLASTAPQLWDSLDGDAESGLRSVKVGGRVLSVASLALSYPSGLAARLVMAKDVSEQAGRRATVQWLSVALAAVATVVVVGGLSLWLKRMFEPLEAAIGAVKALSTGDTSVTLTGQGRDDEIGRMAQAVDNFREHMAALARMERAQERQRRRQENFIHHEMTTLASTLEELAREEILKDLSEIEKEGDGEAGSGLGLMASAFRKMSLRVRQQQQHLQELVNELREALKMKTAYFQLQQELDIAREIQKSMLPLNFPRDNPRFLLHASMEPAKEVGGDFYDFFFIDENRLGLVIADVSGKGVPAAMFMAISRTLLKATALFGSSPARCLANLNNLLAENNEKNLFVTVFYGILDLETGLFTYCNAGHNPPYLIHRDGSSELVPRTRGAALAMIEDLPQTDARIQLAPGESLFLFTDGVVEAQDTAKTLFGDGRLVETLAACAELGPEDLIRRVNSAVQDFVGDAPQFDDITCLAVRWLRMETSA